VRQCQRLRCALRRQCDQFVQEVEFGHGQKYLTARADSRPLEWLDRGSRPPQEFELDINKEVLRILDEVLSLNGRSVAFTRDTPLLGAIPELDSMAVVTLITTLEEQLGLVVDDDDIDGATFATVGSLTEFVSDKLNS
jgi:acyl carrier protein